MKRLRSLTVCLVHAGGAGADVPAVRGRLEACWQLLLSCSSPFLLVSGAPVLAASRKVFADAVLASWLLHASLQPCRSSP